MSALPLVLLHGWGSHAGVWADVIARLELGHAVIAPDFPGGGSTASATACTMDGVVDELAAIAPERCVVAGWSLGGQLALLWAHRHPQQVARVVLIASTPRFVSAPDWVHGMAAATLAGFAAELAADPAATLRRFLLLETRGDAQAHAVVRRLDAALAARPPADPEVLARTLDWLRDTDLRAVLPDIRQAVLVLHGDRDRITPPAAAEYLAAHLPQARLVMLSGAAHAPFISDPDVVCKLMTDFCNELQ
ncbi:MAG: pimeloyl-ACP methyl ester esterase BioH [Burkholderiales bacterium]|jgi:pimeloyl-[acyl-carrier protein] methyl ester esterase|nr:pimeloyl-ACP methyl ester esterase BioH [Burkholderiales bacterium]